MKTTRDLIGLNVFSMEEGRILGRTAECVVDLATGKVLGLVVEGKPGEDKGVARGDITAVGQDAVMRSHARPAPGRDYACARTHEYFYEALSRRL